jgi:predicted 2-oxoglutarate/Fe(II)-dependent dioxygenase YbiX
MDSRRGTTHYKIDTMEVTGTVVAKGASASKTWSADLHRFEPLGSFATFGMLNASVAVRHPTMTVSGIGTLSLSLWGQIVEALKVVATKAPFGLGAATCFNESVRQGW